MNKVEGNNDATMSAMRMQRLGKLNSVIKFSCDVNIESIQKKNYVIYALAL